VFGIGIDWGGVFRVRVSSFEYDISRSLASYIVGQS
jgi:hypothetical protein